MGNNKNGTKGCYFYISKKADEMIDSHIPIADARNRSDFIERAVEAYCGIPDAEENKAILGQEVMRVCKAAVKDSENRLCNYLFKVAGEMGLLSYMVGADLINMTDEEIKKCRYKAFDEVRKQRGMLKLEDVVRKEREIAECEY